MQKIHVKPNNNWMNDPNGFIYYQGAYHLFYQCFPYNARWGRMHWNHVISKDLVHWENLGIALFPSKTDDRSGCFSGSAVEEDGKLYLYYTGVNYTVENPEDLNLCLDEQFVSAQMMITSEDGMQFDNSNSGYSKFANRRCKTHKRSKSLERRGRLVYGAWKYNRRQKRKIAVFQKYRQGTLGLCKLCF